jgi:hypothetical protein
MSAQIDQMSKSMRQHEHQIQERFNKSLTDIAVMVAANLFIVIVGGIVVAITPFVSLARRRTEGNAGGDPRPTLAVVEGGD